MHYSIIIIDHLKLGISGNQILFVFSKHYLIVLVAYNKGEH